MKNKQLIVKMLFCLIIMLFLSINVKALSYEECQNAIRDSAYAYYYRKQGVQYDQQDLVDPLDLNSSKGRYRAGGAFNKTVSPLFYFPPEDATAQDPRYVVCSTFVENVIYETFKSSDGVGLYFVDNEGNIETNTQNLIKYGRRISTNTGNVISGWWRNPDNNDTIENLKNVNKASDGSAINYCNISKCGSKGTDKRCIRNKKNFDVADDKKTPLTYYDVYEKSNLVIFYKGCINSIKWEQKNFGKDANGKTIITEEANVRINKEFKKVYNDFVKVLKVGDIIVRTTRNDSGNIHGHALIVVNFDGKNPVLMDTSAGSGEGDDKGGKYDMTNKKDRTEKTDDGFGTLRTKKMALYGSNDNFRWDTNPSGYYGPKSLLGGSVDELIIMRPSNIVLKGKVKTNDEVKTISYNLSNNVNNRKNKTHLSSVLTANREMYESIAPGDSITYTLTMTNYSKTKTYDASYIIGVPAGTNLETITVNGKLCETKKESCEKYYKGTLSINSGSSVTVKYKVRVRSNHELDSFITNDTVSVNGIKMKTIKTLILKHAPATVKKPVKPSNPTEAEEKKYQEALAKYLIDKKVNNTLNSDKEFLSTFYPGYGLDNKNAEDLIKIIFKVSSTSYKLRKYSGADSNTKFYLDMVVQSPQKEYLVKVKDSNGVKNNPFGNDRIPGLYGGTRTITEYDTKLHDGRILTPRTDSFIEGDILLVVDPKYDSDKSSMGTYNGKYTAYIFVSGNQFITLNGKKIVKLSSDVSKRLIDSLLGQDCFVVLRPRKLIGGTTTTEIQVTSVTLNKEELLLNVKESNTLKATISPSNATNKTITWSSSDKTIATVSSSGKVTAKKAGTVTITAKSNNGKTATCNVKVEAPSTTIDVTSISLNKTQLTLEAYKSQTLEVTVTPSNATNKTITWSSSDTTVATVDDDGLVTGVGIGTATITAKSSNNKTATCSVTITKASGTPGIEEPDPPTPGEEVLVTNIKLNKKKLKLKVGDTSTISATISPSNATNRDLTWESSDEDIVTISNNEVTAVSAGTATITVTSSNGVSASCEVEVKGPDLKEEVVLEEISDITLSKTELTMYTGNVDTIQAIISPSFVKDIKLTWKSNNPNVVVVNNYGSVRAVGKGFARITVSSGSISSECQITVKDRPSSYKSDIHVTNLSLKGNIHPDKDVIDLKPMEHETLLISFEPYNASNKSVTWKSSNPSVVEVDDNGIVLAKKVGSADIIAKSKDGTETRIKINVVGQSVTFIDYLKNNIILVSVIALIVTIMMFSIISNMFKKKKVVVYNR